MAKNRKSFKVLVCVVLIALSMALGGCKDGGVACMFIPEGTSAPCD